MCDHIYIISRLSGFIKLSFFHPTCTFKVLWPLASRLIDIIYFELQPLGHSVLKNVLVYCVNNVNFL